MWLLFKTPSKEWCVGVGLAGDVAGPSEDGRPPPALFGPNPCGGGTEKIFGYPWYIAGCDGKSADGGARGDALGNPCRPLIKGAFEVVIVGPAAAEEDEEGLWGDDGGDTGAPPGGENGDFFLSISDVTTIFNASAVAGFKSDSIQKDLCIICRWSFTLIAVVSISFFSPLICGIAFNEDVGEQQMDGSGDSLFIGELARVGLIGEEVSFGLIPESICSRYNI